jgi:hypothetical protein
LTSMDTATLAAVAGALNHKASALEAEAQQIMDGDRDARKNAGPASMRVYVKTPT